MKTILKNGNVINVFTKTIDKKDVLIVDDTIIAIEDCIEEEGEIIDISGRYICPGLIDSHIHIESTLARPAELSKVCLPHGTTSIIADPHELANVCGTDGIDYILEASKDLPLHVYIMLPSCVPATPLDENGATLLAKDLKPYYQNERVLGLAEVMNYVGVVNNDPDVWQKLADAKEAHKVIDGHAPLLSGRVLDSYIAAGITSDHECSNLDEAKEKLAKGQWIMIREGSSVLNAEALMPLLDEPYCNRCSFATDDKHLDDILENGHIDTIIKKAIKAGKPVINAIQVATINAANRFNLSNVGAIAPGYKADILVLSNLDEFAIESVFSEGKLVVDKGNVTEIAAPSINPALIDKLKSSFNVKPLTKEQLYIEPQNPCRVIESIDGQLLTNELIKEINWDKANGFDLDNDILKVAVIERHKGTGHIGLGLITGIGLKSGAIASSVSHDSHNLIVIGTNDEDMITVANRIIELGGGYAIANNGEILSELPLPLAGLLSDAPANDIIANYKQLHSQASAISRERKADMFMATAFMSLSVIPNIKLTTKGLVDVNTQQFVPLCAKEM